MADLATVSGTVYHNTGAVSRKPWKDAQVQFVPLLLDETAALADSKRIVREMSDDNGHISVDLWPGAWRIILPDGEVIDGATHTGVVLVAGVVYTLLELRGFVPGPEQSVTVIEVPTGLAADVAQALGAAERAETAADEAEQSAQGIAQAQAAAAQSAQSAEDARDAVVTARDDLRARLARTPDMLIIGTITRDALGAATSAAVVWPDGTPGTYIADTVTAGAVDAYHITYGSPVTRTYTQPAVTRDASGAVITCPEIVVS